MTTAVLFFDPFPQSGTTVENEKKRLNEPLSPPVKEETAASSVSVSKEKLHDDSRQCQCAGQTSERCGEAAPAIHPAESGRDANSVSRNEGRTGISQEHWEKSGAEGDRFRTVTDQYGRTIAMEGWLQRREGERPSGDKAVQESFRKQHGLDQSQHAFHILAYEHGGPSTTELSKEKVKENLVGGDGLINQSYHKSFENQITKHLAEGKEIYCKVTISYADDGGRTITPERLTYAYFVRDKHGNPREFEIKEYRVRVDRTPGVRSEQSDRGQKVSEVLDKAGAKDFYDSRSKGQQVH